MIDDIRALVVFGKVAELLSISRAAEQLGLSPATVSAQLGKLEDSLGVPLLYRNTRRLSLTEHGAALQETTRAMSALYAQGMAELRQQAPATALSGTLRIAAPAVLINCTPFMAAMAGFFAAHPALRVEVDFSDRRADLIGEGLDVAFRIGELPDSGLRARPVFRLERVVVAAPALLAGVPALEHPAALAGLPWIGLSMRPQARVFVGPQGERVEVRCPPRITTDNVEAAMRFASQGLGLAAPPRDLFARQPAGTLQPVLPDWSLEPLDVQAVWPANAAADSNAHRLVEHLRKACDAPAAQEV
ncbi:MAG: LysR family transcriptional regulator [Moraxellaceae bacterium]|nr:LysR family transcriptional regulator [Moraxellaceae bacterium]